MTGQPKFGLWLASGPVRLKPSELGSLFVVCCLVERALFLVPVLGWVQVLLVRGKYDVVLGFVVPQWRL